MVLLTRIEQLCLTLIHYPNLIWVSFDRPSTICARKRDGQKISVIQRRPSIPPLIANQLGRNVVFLNEIEDIFWPPHRADNLSISVLNFRSIQRSLGASGFVDETVDWITPTDDDVQRSLYEGRDDEILVPNSDRNIWLRNMRKKRRLEKRRKQKNANL